MSTALNFKSGDFSMISRVGKRIDEQLNAREAIDKLLKSPRKNPPQHRQKISRKLLPPQELIEMLDRQQAEENAEPSEAVTAREKPEENFLFRTQSRFSFYQSTVQTSQRKKDPVPPVGYYCPSFSTVDRSTQAAPWSRSSRVTHKAVSLDEGAMALGVDRTFPVRPTVDFGKQLPRKDVSRRAVTDRGSQPQSPSLHISVPNLSKCLGRAKAFPRIQCINPDYCPDFTTVWKPLARNVSFAKTPGRTKQNSGHLDLVYENVSYAQLKPNVATPSFSKQQQRSEGDSSPLPLFMRNLTSWQCAAGANEKTLQLTAPLRRKEKEKTEKSDSSGKRKTAQTMSSSTSSNAPAKLSACLSSSRVRSRSLFTLS